MRKLIILFVSFFFLYSCSNNITIKDPNLKTTILHFYKEALHYSGKDLDDKENKNIVSVAISKDGNDLRIGLYSFIKLDGKDYIGNTKLDSLTVFFYSDNVEITKKLIEIKSKVSKKNNEEDASETYTEFYKYKNGKLELMTGN